MEVNDYLIEYISGKDNERVKAVAYELKDGWFVFYGARNPADQVLRVRAADVARVTLVAD